LQPHQQQAKRGDLQASELLLPAVVRQLVSLQCLSAPHAHPLQRHKHALSLLLP
jgi:hypothetical protein